MQMRAADNPFSAGRIEALNYRFGPQSAAEAAASLEQLIAEISRHEYCGAIVGPHGSGKSTLLAGLSARLTELGFQVCSLRFNSESTRAYSTTAKFLGRLPSTAILIIDGAEQIGRFGWAFLRRKIQRRKRVIVSAHADGLLPTLFRCVPAPNVAAILADELTGNASKELRQVVEKLYVQHDGNIRNVLWSLYDKAADGDI